MDAPAGSSAGSDVIVGPCKCGGRKVTVRDPGSTALNAAAGRAAASARAAAAAAAPLQVGSSDDDAKAADARSPASASDHGQPRRGPPHRGDRSSSPASAAGAAGCGAAGSARAARGAPAPAAAAESASDAEDAARPGDGGGAGSAAGAGSSSAGACGAGSRGGAAASASAVLVVPPVVVRATVAMMASASACPVDREVVGFCGAPADPRQTSLPAVDSDPDVQVQEIASCQGAAAVVAGVGHTKEPDANEILAEFGIEQVRIPSPAPFPWPKPPSPPPASVSSATVKESKKRSRVPPSTPPVVPSARGTPTPHRSPPNSRRRRGDSPPPPSPSLTSSSSSAGSDSERVDGGFTGYPEDAPPREPPGPLPNTPAMPENAPPFNAPRTIAIIPPTPDYPSKALGVLTGNGAISPLQKPGLQGDDASRRKSATKSAHTSDLDTIKLASTTGGVATLAFPEVDGATHALQVKPMWWLIVRRGKTVWHVDGRRSFHTRKRVVTIVLRLPIGRGTVELHWADGSIIPLGRGTIVAFGNKIGLNVDWGDDLDTKHRYVFRGTDREYEQGLLAAFLVLFITPPRITAPRLSAAWFHVQSAHWSTRQDVWSRVFPGTHASLVAGCTSPLDLIFKHITKLLPGIERLFVMVDVCEKKYKNSAPSRSIAEYTRATSTWQWHLSSPSLSGRPSDVWIILKWGGEVSVWQPSASRCDDSGPASPPGLSLSGSGRGGRGGGAFRGRRTTRGRPPRTRHDDLGDGLDLGGDGDVGASLLLGSGGSVGAGTGGCGAGAGDASRTIGGGGTTLTQPDPSLAHASAAAAAAAAASATAATAEVAAVTAVVRDLKDEINGLRAIVSTERDSRTAAEEELASTRSELSALTKQHGDLREKTALLMGHCKQLVQRHADMQQSKRDVEHQLNAQIAQLMSDKANVEAALATERQRAEVATERGQQMALMQQQVTGAQLLAMAGKEQSSNPFPTPTPVSFPKPVVVPPAGHSLLPTTVAPSSAPLLVSPAVSCAPPAPIFPQAGVAAATTAPVSSASAAPTSVLTQSGSVVDGRVVGAGTPQGQAGSAGGHPTDRLDDVNAALALALGS